VLRVLLHAAPVLWVSRIGFKVFPSWPRRSLIAGAAFVFYGSGAFSVSRSEAEIAGLKRFD
jgi:hypothetical protein